MPTYDYQCPVGHHFELFQRMSDPPRAKCPACGRPAARRITGGAGLIFKGSGFYITDYGKDGKGPRSEKDGPPKAADTSANPDPPAGKPAEKPSEKPGEKQGEKPGGSKKAKP